MRIYARLPFSTTALHHPLQNRWNRDEPDLGDNPKGRVDGKNIRRYLPFTTHATGVNGERLRGIHTKDNALGKTFRVMRTLLVGVSAVAGVGLAVAAHFVTGGAALIPLGIATAVFGGISLASLIGVKSTTIKDLCARKFYSSLRKDILSKAKSADPNDRSIRLPFCSTSFFRPDLNRWGKKERDLGKWQIKGIRHFLPFTLHAKDASGEKYLRGLHTRDNHIGKIFRTFRSVFVGAVVVSGIGLAATHLVFLGGGLAIPLALNIATSVVDGASLAAVGGLKLTNIKDEYARKFYSSHKDVLQKVREKLAEKEINAKNNATPRNADA